MNNRYIYISCTFDLSSFLDEKENDMCSDDDCVLFGVLEASRFGDVIDDHAIKGDNDSNDLDDDDDDDDDDAAIVVESSPIQSTTTSPRTPGDKQTDSPDPPCTQSTHRRQHSVSDCSQNSSDHLRFVSRITK